jgi:hypothetical protein
MRIAIWFAEPRTEPSNHLDVRRIGGNHPTMDTSSWLQFAGTFVPASIAFGAAVIAFRNWNTANEVARNNARWKRAELAAAYLMPLFSEEELAFALRCLDWGVGPIPVPKKHQALINGETIDHDPGILVKAMEPRLNQETLETPQGLLYRLAFDALFVRLEFIGNRVSNGLIDTADIRDIESYLHQLARWPYAPAGKSKEEVFLPFLKANRYDRILDLIRALPEP